MNGIDLNDTQAPHGWRHQRLQAAISHRCAPAALRPTFSIRCTVEAYGSRMPLNQVANITVPEPRMLAVSVWDKSMVNAVDRAIREIQSRPQPDRRRPEPAHSAAGTQRGAPQVAGQGRARLCRKAPRLRFAMCAATAWTALKRPKRTATSARTKAAAQSEQGAENDRRYDFRRSTACLARRKRKSCRSRIFECGLQFLRCLRPHLPDGINVDRRHVLALRRACRHHHGWQWPLGKAARAAADDGPSQGRRGRSRDRARGRRRGVELSDAFRLLLGELAPAGNGGQ